jgi:hypothetical protein
VRLKIQNAQEKDGISQIIFLRTNNMRIHDYIKLISEESKFPIGVKIEVICNLEPIMKSDRAYWDVINQMTTGKGVSDFIDRARPKIKEAIEDHFEQANKLTNWLADTQNTTTEKDILLLNKKRLQPFRIEPADWIYRVYRTPTQRINKCRHEKRFRSEKLLIKLI